MEVQNLNDYGIVKSVIGTGTVNISALLSNPNDTKEISIDLTTPKKKKQKGNLKERKYKQQK